STEGNISMMNYTGKVGAVGRIPPYLKSSSNGELIRYDVENDREVRGPDGFAIRTKPGEIGELIGEIRSDEPRFSYDGYESREATEKKILHDVFRKGDRWFRTGDLLWRDKDGYFYFADRIGDTFRWKAENVATNEVADAISRFDGVEQANVYGVPIPGYDGKAGMASLVVKPGLDLKALHKHIHTALPPYARPLFLRMSQETDTTGTFKYKKTDLVKQGFDPSLVKDRLFVDLPGTDTYTPLTKAVYEKILGGEYRF
ncbi:MAG TPA: long-chain-acyl-CoA synthetase, partial [Rhizobiales bacterium]|nr:long-chain-acyl-CoA synthetase [Hyphomicrobiales bacterium]